MPCRQPGSIRIALVDGDENGHISVRQAFNSVAEDWTLDDTNKNNNWPDITAQCTVADDDKSLDTPLSQVQQSLIASAIRQNSGQPMDPGTTTAAAVQAKSLKTYRDALLFMHPDAP